MGIAKKTWKIGGYHRGVVVDNDDPKQWGRVRVRVLGFFDGINVQYLPWAVPAMSFSVGGGAGSGFGSFCVPEVNSTVWCFFEGEDYNQPVYFAAAPDGVHGLPSERITNYPNRRVIKTSSGIILYVDSTSNVVKLEHPSGKIIQMDGDGNVTVTANDLTVTASGNVTISGSQVDINP